MLQNLFILVFFALLIFLQIISYKMVQRLNEVLGKVNSLDQYLIGTHKNDFAASNLKTYKVLWSLKQENGTPVKRDPRLLRYRLGCMYGYALLIVLALGAMIVSVIH